MSGAGKASVACGLLGGLRVGDGLFRLDFAWDCAGFPIRAGQFFMVKPRRSGVFLGRPLGAADWRPADGRSPGSVGFAVALRGKGTRELAQMRPGDEADLVGPLGNAWGDFLPSAGEAGDRPVALVGGGIGIAPLAPLSRLGGNAGGPAFELYAGFKTKSMGADMVADVPGALVATEDGSAGLKGSVVDFLEPEKHSAVCACGPEPMMRAVAKKCADAGVPCFVSLERRMACGVGACLGCAVETAKGNRRCCADGPVFRAEEVFFQ